MTAWTIRRQRTLTVVLCALPLGILSLVSCGSAEPTTTIPTSVAPSSATESQLGFSNPGPVDATTALDALVSAIASHPDDYAGVSSATDATGQPTAVVHLVEGTKITADVASFMAAATDAGITVSTDVKRYSLTQLTVARDALPTSEAFSDNPQALVSAEIDVEANKVRATVTRVTSALTAAVKAEFGSRVTLVAAG